MLQRRVITGSIISVVVTIILFVGKAWVFSALVTVFIILGLNEFFRLVEAKQISVNRKLGIILGVVLAVATYFDYRMPQDWLFIFIPIICLVIFLVQFTKRDEGALLSMATIFFGLVYISWFLSFFIRLRTMPLGTDLLRCQLIAYLILVTKSSDIGAYFIGRKFGKHALIPRISPKKSVEGMMGGLFVSIAVSLGCVVFLPSLPLGHLLSLGLLLGVLAQVGDLSESLIKRDCAVKDSGDALPGMGGILDTVDSLLFTAPTFYFYVKVFLQ